MPDKQTTLPVIVPSWANDELFDDPGEDWHADVTKVEPGNGLRDDGFIPNVPPGAEHVNLLFNEDKRWIQFLSSIQVVNWSTVPGSGTLPDNNTGQGLCFDEGIFAWVVVGSPDAIAESRDNGSYFSSENTGLSINGVDAEWTWCVSKPPSLAPVHVGRRVLVGSGANEVVDNYLVELSTSSGLPQINSFNIDDAGGIATRTYKGIWDYDNNQWIVIGTRGGVPAFWTSGTPIATLTRVDPTTVNSTFPIDIAIGENNLGTTITVVIGDGNAPDIDIWILTGSTWARHTPTGIVATESCRSIVYSIELNSFFLLTAARCYRSIDGINWVDVAGQELTTFAIRSAAVAGGTILASVGQYILYSLDQGVSWGQIPSIESVDINSKHSIVNIAYSRITSRFWYTIVNDDVNPPVASGIIGSSLAVGDTFRLTTGISTPQV